MLLMKAESHSDNRDASCTFFMTASFFVTTLLNLVASGSKFS